MPTYRLIAEYDGTDFHGWQRQPSVRTVAGTLSDALQRLTAEPVKLTAAGRTDAGAHAHGQVAGVTLHRDWDAHELRAALNASLPRDVGIVAVTREADGFHARRDATSRTYRYVVQPRERSAPVTRRHAWTVSGPLDIDTMRRAASALIGTRDFAVFGAPTNAGGTTVRTVEAVSVEQHAIGNPESQRMEFVVVSVRANAFLRGMMRAIAGALVAVGQGRRPETWLSELFATGSARPAFLPLAPAHGLHQWSVAYGVAA